MEWSMCEAEGVREREGAKEERERASERERRRACVAGAAVCSARAALGNLAVAHAHKKTTGALGAACTFGAHVLDNH